MLVAERWQKILELLGERGSIRVTELSELCEVTEETIRRDLDKLEKDGKLLRSHGGAISIRETRTEVPFLERETINSEEKRRIAAAAIAMIEPKERILLDASTTAWWMAKLLPDMPLTVMTNSINVAMELSGKEKIQVISTGGVLSTGSMSYVGPLAERSLEQYFVDKLFFSCKGVHPERGVSEMNELQALVKRRMIESASETYLLADYSKFGVQAFAQVASWDKIRHVVTDSRTEPRFLAPLREQGIGIIQVDA